MSWLRMLNWLWIQLDGLEMAAKYVYILIGSWNNWFNQSWVRNPVLSTGTLREGQSSLRSSQLCWVSRIIRSRFLIVCIPYIFRLGQSNSCLLFTHWWWMCNLEFWLTNFEDGWYSWILAVARWLIIKYGWFGDLNLILLLWVFVISRCPWVTPCSLFLSRVVRIRRLCNSRLISRPQLRRNWLGLEVLLTC